MTRFILFLAAVLAATPAWALNHLGAPAGAPWYTVLWLEIECLFTTSWYVFGLIMSGHWSLLADLDGLCATGSNQLFFADPWTAALTVLSMVIIALSVIIAGAWRLLHRSGIVVRPQPIAV